MSRSVRNLILVLVVCFAWSGLFERAAFAQGAFALTPTRCLLEGSRVRVQAYEYDVQGVVVGDGRSVVVPSAVTEVNRPGPIDAVVSDASGVKQDAHLVASDRTGRVSLLRVRAAFSVVPLDAKGAANDGCVFPVGSNEAEIAELMASPSMPPHRRSWIPYGGGSMGIEFTPRGGGWFGGSISFAARYRDVLELRVDGSVSFLTPSIHTKDTCGEPPCLIGLRGVLTHSIGPRLVLGGSRPLAVAITPSVGWSLGAQSVSLTDRTPAFDLGAPNGWQALTTGVTVSYGPFEARTLVRLPRAEMNQPTFDLAFGFMF